MALPSALQDREIGKFDLNEDGEIIVRTTATGTFKQAGLSTRGRITEVIINSETWTQVPVVGEPGRSVVAIQNQSSELLVKLNYSDDIDGFVGAAILPNYGERQYVVTDGIVHFAKCSSGTMVLIVEELV